MCPAKASSRDDPIPRQPLSARPAPRSDNEGAPTSSLSDLSAGPVPPRPVWPTKRWRVLTARVASSDLDLTEVCGEESPRSAGRHPRPRPGSPLGLRRRRPWRATAMTAVMRVNTRTPSSTATSRSDVIKAADGWYYAYSIESDTASTRGWPLPLGTGPRHGGAACGDALTDGPHQPVATRDRRGQRPGEGIACPGCVDDSH